MMQMSGVRALPLVLLLVAVAFLVACGGDDGGESDGGDGTPDATATPEPTETPTEAPTETPTATPTPFAGEVARLEIPRFDVSSEVEAVGVTNNQMDTPEDPHNTGFYAPRLTGWGGEEFLPGWDGNALFSAHVDYWPDIVGPFNRLADMEPGDQVIVVMADGTEYTYEVLDEPTRYPVEEFPSGELIEAPNRPEGADWITLITCGGDVVGQDSPNGPGSYTHRDVVIAERVS